VGVVSTVKGQGGRRMETGRRKYKKKDEIGTAKAKKKLRLMRRGLLQGR